MRRVIVKESMIRNVIHRLIVEQSGDGADYLGNLTAIEVSSDKANAYRLVNYIFFSRTHPASANSDVRVVPRSPEVVPIVSNTLGPYDSYADMIDKNAMDGSVLLPLVSNFLRITMGPKFEAPTGESIPVDQFASNFGKILPAFGWSTTISDSLDFIKRIIGGGDPSKVPGKPPSQLQLSAPIETLTVTAQGAQAAPPATINISETVLQLMIKAGAAANSEVKITAAELNNVVNKIEPLASKIVDYMRAPFGISGADTGLVPDILRPDELKGIADTLIKAYDDPANFQGQRSPKATCFAVVNGVNLVYGRDTASFLSTASGVAAFAAAGMFVGALMVPGNRFYRVLNMGADAGAAIKGKQALNNAEIEALDKSLSSVTTSAAHAQLKAAVEGIKAADAELASITEKGQIKSILDEIGIREEMFISALAASRQEAAQFASYNNAKSTWNSILTAEKTAGLEALRKAKAGQPTKLDIDRMNMEVFDSAREAFKSRASRQEYEMVFDTSGRLKEPPVFDKSGYESMERAAQAKATLAGKESSAVAKRQLAQSDLDKIRFKDPIDGTESTGQDAYDRIQDRIRSLEAQKSEKQLLATSLENQLKQIDMPASLKESVGAAIVEYMGRAVLGKGAGFYMGRLISACILSVVANAAWTLSAFVTDPAIFNDTERGILQSFLAAGMNRSTSDLLFAGATATVADVVPGDNHLSKMASEWSRKKLSTYGSNISGDTDAIARYTALADAISAFAQEAVDIDTGISSATAESLRTVLKNVDKA